MNSTHNEGKSVVAERFIRTLKNTIYKHMTATSKYVYFAVSDNIVDKYNNTNHRTIKMKPVDVADDSFAEYNGELNEKDPKFKVSDQGYAPNWSEEVFVIKKIKNTVLWKYVLSDFI